jgi:hypothetical protein
VLKKFQFPLSVLMLIVVIFGWKTVLEKRFPQARFSIITEAEKEPELISLTVLKVSGKASISNGAKKSFLAQGQVLKQPWMVQTLDNSYLVLGYGEGFTSQLKVSQNTSFSLTSFKEKIPVPNQGIFIDLHSGVILFKTFNPSKKKILKVRAPAFSMGIRGATFLVEANEEKSILIVKEGMVEIENKNGKPKFAHAGDGISGTNENDIAPIEATNYKIAWDTENEPTAAPPSAIEAKTTSIDISRTLEEEITRMSNNIEEHRVRNLAFKKETETNVGTIDQELQRLSNDKACLIAMMKDCEFTSNKFKNDVANLKNNPTHFSANPAMKANLEKEFDKEKALQEQQKASLNSDLEHDDKDFQTELEKLGNVRTKYEGLSKLDEPGRINSIKEIVELIDTASMREAARKAGMYK